jgi:hypothetical protein
VLDDVNEWRLPIEGYEVTDVWFSGQLSVIAYDSANHSKRGIAVPGEHTRIAFGGPFRLRTAHGHEHDLNAEEPWDTLIPVLALRHHHVIAATATRTGSLVVSFDDGAALSAEPDPRYENWELSGPGNIYLVAPPGGGDPRIAH